MIKKISSLKNLLESLEDYKVLCGEFWIKREIESLILSLNNELEFLNKKRAEDE